MRRNPPGYRLFKRTALEKFLVLMESPIADNVSVPQVAGVTLEAHSWLSDRFDRVERMQEQPLMSSQP